MEDITMNLKVVAYLAFTHHESKGKSIRQLASEIGMNPGGFYRLLKQLGLVHPEEKKRKRHFLDNLTDVSTSCPHCGCSLIDDESSSKAHHNQPERCFHDTPPENKKNHETETPETLKTPETPRSHRHPLLAHFLDGADLPRIIAGEDDDDNDNAVPWDDDNDKNNH
jgi:hypothetical protein